MTITAPTSSSWLDDGLTAHAPAGGGVQTAYGKVAGVARILDTGSAVTPWHGVAAFEPSVLWTADGETYLLIVEGCAASDFSGAKQDLASWNLGVINPQDVIALSNVYDEVVYRYVRLKIVVSGTTPLISVKSFIKPLSDLDDYTLAELITVQATVAQNIQNATSNFRAWMTGVVGGGPNNDGKYPLSDGLGNTVLVTCPAQIDADGGGFTLDSILELDSHDYTDDRDEDAPVLVPAVIQEGGLDYLKKIDVLSFASPKIDRMQQEFDLLNIEFLPALDYSGLEKKIALGQILKNFGGVIDPTQFGVSYDYIDYREAALNSGSSIIATTTDEFSPATTDGKEFAIANGTSPGTPLTGYLRYVDARHAQMYDHPTAGSPIVSTVTVSNEQLGRGTDQTVAMQAAADAGESTSPYQHGRVIQIGGKAWVRKLRFGRSILSGFSSSGCGFVCKADPTDSSTQGTIRNKNNKINFYALRGLGIWGNKYLRGPTFRRPLEIGGGLFSDVYQGAPYAMIEDIVIWESPWDGAYLYGAFAGTIYSLKAFMCDQFGYRDELQDGNAMLIHCEGNGYAGMLYAGTGGNYSTVKMSFNGTKARNTSIYWLERAANMTIVGSGAIFGNVRCQESFGDQLMFSNTDPGNSKNDTCHDNKINVCTFDDTGNQSPHQEMPVTHLPPVRAAVHFKGASTQYNTVRLADAGPSISKDAFGVPINYMTHAYYDDGLANKNRVELDTPRLSNDPADYYHGIATVIPGRNVAPIPEGTGVYAPGPWGSLTSDDPGADTIAERNPKIKINGETPA